MHNRDTDRYRLLSRSGSVLVLIVSLMLADAAVGDDKVARFTAGPPSLGHYTPLTPVQLEDLVGPISLYPDDLIGIILPASTDPVQVVEAVRFLDRHASDPNLKPNPEWDESIIALLNYPEVLRLMDKNLDWTVKLGQAVAVQQEQLLGAIQRFRKRANAAGNLNSDDKQRVVRQGDNIEIEPVNPEEIYIPSYNPQQVVISEFSPVYDYYPVGFPVYYYPYAPDYQFSTGFFWGVSTAFVINWNSHYLQSYRSNNFHHPYYRSSFYTNSYLYRNWHDQRGGYTADQNNRRQYYRGRRQVTVTAALPHRQSVSANRGLVNQPPLLRNARSFTGINTTSASTATVTGDSYRQRTFRSRYTGSINGTTAGWSSNQSASVYINRNNYSRASLPHITTTTNSSSTSPTYWGNSRSHSSRAALPWRRR